MKKFDSPGLLFNSYSVNSHMFPINILIPQGNCLFTITNFLFFTRFCTEAKEVAKVVSLAEFSCFSLSKDELVHVKDWRTVKFFIPLINVLLSNVLYTSIFYIKITILLNHIIFTVNILYRVFLIATPKSFHYKWRCTVLGQCEKPNSLESQCWGACWACILTAALGLCYSKVRSICNGPMGCLEIL